jgi:hypothetical protein
MRKRGASGSGRGDAEELVDRPFADDIEIGGKRMMLGREAAPVESPPLPRSIHALDAALAKLRRGFGAAASPDQTIVRDDERNERDDRNRDPSAEVKDGDENGREEEDDASEGDSAFIRAQRRGLGTMGREALFVNGVGIGHGREYMQRDRCNRTDVSSETSR